MNANPCQQSQSEVPNLLAIVPSAWDNENGPEGASTPESPGLTCVTRSKRGARL